LEAGQADGAIDATEFEGFEQPVGPITREQLFVLYPRIFEFTERLGYTVWTANIAGWILELALKEAYSQQLPVSLAGMTVDVDDQGNASNLKIGGQPVQALHNYKIAMPEAFARGAIGISKYLKLVIQGARDTGVPIWTANEQHLKRIGGVVKAPTTPDFK
jgi:hypothetical protein